MEDVDTLRSHDIDDETVQLEKNAFACHILPRDQPGTFRGPLQGLRKAQRSFGNDVYRRRLAQGQLCRVGGRAPGPVNDGTANVWLRHDQFGVARSAQMNSLGQDLPGDPVLEGNTTAAD